MNTFSRHYGQPHHPNCQIQVSTFDSSFPLGSRGGLSQLYETNLLKRPVTIMLLHLKKPKGRAANES